MDSERQLSLRLGDAPWNRDGSPGRSARRRRRTFGQFGSGLQLEHRKRDLAVSNLAIDSKLRGCDHVRLQVNDTPTFRRRQTGQSSSRSPSRPEHRLMPGFRPWPHVTENTSSRAASGSSRTSQRDSMLGSSMPGSRAPD
jgi:hypothetical protein